MNIAVIRTGTANLASVVAALSRLSVNARVVAQPEEVTSDDAVVLPGVGAFSAGMEALARRGWDEFIVERFASGQPTLAICLGFQLLCERSEEDPATRGLGLLPVEVRRLPDDVSVPHLGWNTVESTTDFFEPGWVYYANSYCVEEHAKLTQTDWEVAVTHHGVDFVAAIRRGALLACQFHPELSGRIGQRLLARWLAVAAEQLDLQTSGQLGGRSAC